jgi:hypothetical protein
LAEPTLFSGLSHSHHHKIKKKTSQSAFFSHSFLTGALQYTNITATEAFFHIQRRTSCYCRDSQTKTHGMATSTKGYHQLTARAAHTQLCGKLSQHFNYITTIQKHYFKCIKQAAAAAQLPRHGRQTEPAKDEPQHHTWICRPRW